jgi:hypothetical protein
LPLLSLDFCDSMFINTVLLTNYVSIETWTNYLLDKFVAIYQSKTMTDRTKLAKIADVERETQYGYVFRVCGSGNEHRWIII